MSTSSYYRPSSFDNVVSGTQKPVSNISDTFSVDNSFFKGSSGVSVGSNSSGSSGGSGSGISTLGAINTGASLLATLGGLWSAHEQNKLAKEEFAFNKDMFNKKWTAYMEDRQRKHDFENSVGDQYDRINHTGKYAKDTTTAPVTTPQGKSKQRGTASPVTSTKNQKTQQAQYTRPKNQNVGV